MPSSTTPHETSRPRAEVLADAVVSAYVHQISERHRPSATAEPQEADGADPVSR